MEAVSKNLQEDGNVLARCCLGVISSFFGCIIPIVENAIGIGLLLFLLVSFLMNLFS